MVFELTGEILDGIMIGVIDADEVLNKQESEFEMEYKELEKWKNEQKQEQVKEQQKQERLDKNERATQTTLFNFV